MSTTRNRTKRSPGRVTSPRRRQPRAPELQLSPGSGHTDWTCPVCRARGTVQHPTAADESAIRSLVREQHSIKQPSCDVR